MNTCNENFIAHDWVMQISGIGFALCLLYFIRVFVQHRYHASSVSASLATIFLLVVFPHPRFTHVTLEFFGIKANIAELRDKQDKLIASLTSNENKFLMTAVKELKSNGKVSKDLEAAATVSYTKGKVTTASDLKTLLPKDLVIPTDAPIILPQSGVLLQWVDPNTFQRNSFKLPDETLARIKGALDSGEAKSFNIGPQN